MTAIHRDQLSKRTLIVRIAREDRLVTAHDAGIERIATRAPVRVRARGTEADRERCDPTHVAN